MAITTSREDAVGEEAGALRSAAAAEAMLLDLLRRHADELLRVARLRSLCADDAHDAYQRGLEQFLRHGRRLHSETAAQWLFTVVKREALAVGRARGQLLGPEAFDVDRLEARDDASPEDRALAADAVARSAEALQVLKPQEVRALWLRADGRSYAEIQAATGWSYTKVNRCLTEGRRRFLARCAALEAGVECEQWGPALAALALGEADAAAVAALRPHLRACGACRATLRGLHASSASMATVLPPGLVGVAATEAHGGAERLEAAGRWLTRLYEAVAGPVQERAAVGAMKWQLAVEAAAGGKVAAVAASTVALASGGAAIAQDAARPDRPPVERPRVAARGPEPPRLAPALAASRLASRTPSEAAAPRPASHGAGSPRTPTAAAPRTPPRAAHAPSSEFRTEARRETPPTGEFAAASGTGGGFSGAVGTGARSRAATSSTPATTEFAPVEPAPAPASSPPGSAAPTQEPAAQAEFGP